MIMGNLNKTTKNSVSAFLIYFSHLNGNYVLKLNALFDSLVRTTVDTCQVDRDSRSTPPPPNAKYDEKRNKCTHKDIEKTNNPNIENKLERITE